MAYAKIPAEKGGSKLDAWSIKGVLIGYFGRDAYRIFDPESRKIFHSRDVVFEEGTGHKTLLSTGSSSGGTDHVITLDEPLNAPPTSDDPTPAHNPTPAIIEPD